MTTKAYSPAVRSFIFVITLSVVISIITWSLRIRDELETRAITSFVSFTNKTAAWNQEEFHQNWDVSRLGGQEKLQKICDATFWDAWRNAVRYLPYDGATYVISDSVGAMRIRESTEQIWPYFAWFQRYEFVQRVIRGVILKQSEYILEDIHANSYRGSAYCYHSGTKSLRKYVHLHVMSNGFALDSGAFYIKLLNEYRSQMMIDDNQTADSILDHKSVKQAVIELINVWKNGQHHLDVSTGMIWSQFRPSNEECQFQYHIPSNFMIHHALDFVKEFASYWKNQTMLVDCNKLQRAIWDGIHKFGVTQQDGFGMIYVYETDGNGQHKLMDDVHIPSLLTIPLITDKYDETIYSNTRKWILNNEASQSPMGLMSQALTTKDEEEKYSLILTVIGMIDEKSYLLPGTERKDWWINAYFAVFANCAEQFIVGDIDKTIATNQQKYIGLIESNNAGILGNSNDRTFSRKDPKTLDFVFSCTNTNAEYRQFY